MVARNEHTGAKIKTKPASSAYRENFDKAFSRTPTEEVVQQPLSEPDEEQNPKPSVA